MKRILIRAAMSPYSAPSPLDVLTKDLIGNNSGNLLFPYSVCRALDTGNVSITNTGRRYRWDPSFADEINSEFDYFVIPLADAFRPTYAKPLRQLAKLIRKLKIPCVVTGVGLRADIEPALDQPFPYDGAVREFVSAVLDKSAKIGVRGEITAQYLAGLGFGEHVEVIGCPSMFLHGDTLPQRQPEDAGEEELVTFHSSVIAPPAVHRLVEEGLRSYPRHFIIPQDTDELRLLYAGIATAPPISVPGYYPHLPSGVEYQKDRMRFFVNVPSWVDFMKQVDFNFGARMHGAIAGILGGAPSLLVATCARTRELAEYHRIPHVRSDRLTEGITLKELRRQADFTHIHQGHRERFLYFLRFLEKNGLEHAYGPRGDAKQTPFDEKIRRLSPPGPVGTLAGIPPEEAAQRRERFSNHFNQRKPGRQQGDETQQINKSGGKRSMVIYHTANMFNLYKSMVHKLAYHDGEDAVLVCIDWLCPVAKKSPVFRQVISYKTIFAAEVDQKFQTVEDAEAKIVEHFDRELEKLSHPLSDFNQIYIGSYYGDFAAYACLKKAAHVFMEEANGTLFREKTDFFRSDPQRFPIGAQLRKKYGMYGGENHYVTRKLCLMEAQDKQREDSKAEDFDCQAVAVALSPEKKEQILRAFDLSSLATVNQKSSLLLTQRYLREGKRLVSDRIPLKYQRLLDYTGAVKGKLMIKPHPGDLNDYRKYFPNAHVVDRSFPSELLLLNPDNRYETAITINSYSIVAVQRISNQTVEAGAEYDRYEKHLDKVYMSLILARNLFGFHTNLTHYGALGGCFDFFKKYATADPELVELSFQIKWKKLRDIGGAGVYIINDFDYKAREDGIDVLFDRIRGLSDDSAVIFLNNFHKNWFCSGTQEDLMEYIVPLRLQKVPAAAHAIDTGADYLYVYCRDPEKRRQIREFRWTKNLPYCGVRMELTPLEKEGEALHMLRIQMNAMRDAMGGLQQHNAGLERRMEETKQQGDHAWEGLRTCPVGRNARNLRFRGYRK